MAIPILRNWQQYFAHRDEGLGSSYERIILNRKLEEICRTFRVENVEVPSFGFTGLSGINSLDMAKSWIKVSLIDHDQDRLRSIKAVWQEVNADLNDVYSSDYTHLPFADKNFDLSWNFSALWFVPDQPVFLQELRRVTQKVILICVPNRSGIGYLTQKYLGRKDLKALLHEEHIMPGNIRKIMSQNNWKLLDSGYIDCPPWPDIGMPKEKFLKIFGLSWLLPAKKEHEPLSVMDYYNGTDPDFPQKMMKHFWWEKTAPAFLKKFWAHHRFLLFIPQTDEK